MNLRKTKAQMALEEAAVRRESERYVLRLFIAGSTPRSTLAIRNIRKICEEHLPGRYDLQVVDAYQQPALAESEHVIAAPTLVKKRPLPLRRLIGDMSDTARLLVVLDVRPADDQPPSDQPTPAPS